MRFRFLKNQQLVQHLGLMCVATVASMAALPGAQAESPRQTPIVRAIKRAEAAVVNIHGNKTITNASTNGGAPTKQEVNGMGTGVIIDPRGYIITNLHVVEDVARIEVTLADGTNTHAKLLNYDPETDLALIKIPTNRELPTIPVGSSSDLMRGETVIAIGNPFGYNHTVTVGIVSGLHRDIAVNGTQQYLDLIQTNADINPGNSGGPLLNIDGDVIGINVAVRIGAQGIGFAIPIDKSLDVIADLVAASNSEPVTLGVECTRVVRPEGSELVVNNAKFQGTGELQPGDKIQSIDGVAIRNRMDMELALLSYRAGNSVDLGIDRNGSFLSQSVSVRSLGSNASPTDVTKAAWEQLGLRLVPVPASAVTGVGEDYKGGLKVTDVRPGSPSDRERIVAGDIIVGVMDWQTPNMKSLAWILANQSFRSSPSAKYYLIRKRRPMTVAMSPDSSVYR